MSRIVFAWELRDNHGHLWRLLPLAIEMRSRGHEVAFGLRSMTAAQRYLAPTGIRWLACPMSAGAVLPGREIASYTDILAIHGATRPDLLGGMVQGWLNPYALLGVDLVVIEHNPFALLAARRARIPSVQVGTDFTIAPTLSPAPCFRSWQPGHVEAQKQTGEAVRRTVQSLFDKPYSLGQLLTVDHTRGLSVPELDHYAAFRPPGTTFLGPAPAPYQGSTQTSSQSRRPRIFAYLYLQPWMEAVLGALDATGAEVIVVIAALEADWSPRYPTLRFYRRPVQLAPLLAECTLAVTHAGHGTTADCLLADVPMVHLRLHIEQLLAAERLAATGAGLGLRPTHVGTGFANVLGEVLRNPR